MTAGRDGMARRPGGDAADGGRKGGPDAGPVSGPVAGPPPTPDGSPAPTPDGAVRLGVVMLCHDNLPLAARMTRIWAEGGARVAMHIDAKAPEAEVARLRAALSDIAVTHAPRRSCAWGTFSLVAATQDTAAALLRAHPDLTHVLLVSGACLPLRPPAELMMFLARHPGADFIESVNVHDVGWTIGGLHEERFTLHFPVSFRRNRKLFDRLVNIQRRIGIKRRLPPNLAPHIGSQWWCLTAPTLRAILDDPRRRELDRYFRRVWVPDESYFQTLVRRHSKHIESRSLTLARFDNQGKPFTFYDDHLALLAGSHVFVVRKIWPGARALYAALPRAGGADATEEPDPQRLEALLDRAATRRRYGRPGLYMQSRFPRKDVESRKTAQPYAAIYGLSDLFVDLPDWLGRATGRAIHGHLLADHDVHFAGAAAIGPGALPASPGLRDLDRQSFITSLIRSSADMPGFMLSPRDAQDLNWFFATDPNAVLFVVTGAWVVPLLQADMPFDDVRRMAARLQRAEIAFLDILDSIWVRARVRRRTLTEVIADPRHPLTELCQVLRPDLGGRLPDLPALRDLSSITDLLRRLRNAGLQPRRMGDPRLLRALTVPADAVGTGLHGAGADGGAGAGSGDGTRGTSG